VNGTIARQIEQSLAELRALVAELTHPRRMRIAEIVAAHAGIGVAQAYAATDVSADEQGAALQYFGGRMVDLAELTRWLAERRGCTAAETNAAVDLAQRLHEPLCRAVDTPPPTPPEAAVALPSPAWRNIPQPTTATVPRARPTRQPTELQAY